MASKHAAEASDPDLSNVALRSASSLMGLQIFSRLISFALNQALVRLSTPDVYGMVSIQLELLLNTILFLSREGFRNALLRADARDEGRKKTNVLISNLALLPIYLGIPVAIITSTIYFSVASLETRLQPLFKETVLLYTLAAILELFSEPMHIRSVQTLNSSLRVKAEGTAVTARSALTVAILAYDILRARTNGSLSLLAFALGQVAYAASLFSIYRLNEEMSMSFKMKLPRDSELTSRETNSPGLALYRRYFDSRLLDISVAMTMQGVVKHALTEGDKFIISSISPLKDQGGYAIASNYGALIARIVFQPIEETSRLFFSKTLTSKASEAGDAFGNALSRLASILLIYHHVALVVISLGPSYLSVVLAMLLPTRYWGTSAPTILRAWVWYIPVLATNGVLEAFVSSAASPADLARQSRWMAIASVAYVTLTICLYFAGLADTAVIYANIANLTGRIIYCYSFITQKMEDLKVRRRLHLADVFPSKKVLYSCIFAATVTQTSSYIFNINALVENAGKGVLLSSPCLLHIGVGIFSACVILLACLHAERKNLAHLFELFKRRRKRD